MHTMKNPYRLFNTDGQILHGISASSGDFNTFIDIATIIGNNGAGPTIDLKLFYNRNFLDYIFGNWSLNFTHAIYIYRNYYDDRNESRGEVFLNNGESWKWDGDGDISTPSVLVKSSANGFFITQKNGETTVLAPLVGFTTIEDQENASELLITQYLPIQIISQSGRTLTLEWSNHRYTTRKGLDSTTPRLDSISDESNTLLTVRYLTSQEKTSVTFDVYPNTANHYSYTLNIEPRFTAYDLSEKHFGVVKAVQTNPPRIQNFSYFIAQGNRSTLKQITHSSGLTETLEYTDDLISNHTLTDANSTIIQKNIFSYKATPYGYSTKLVSIENNHTESFFDNDGQQTKQIVSHNGHKKTISTQRTLKKGTQTTTPDTMEILTTTTYENPSRQSRTEEIKVILDVLGNIISKIENGTVTEWTYYRGMPNEETLVKTETYSDTSGVIAKVALIGDYVNPIGWGFLLFGKAGLTWGTREIRTVTHSRFVTNGGRITYNLPVDIGCPGDPNYFKVYVESEKVYTFKDGQRVDLLWTFYGYGELPVTSNLIKGPAVKPTTKLIIRNPVTSGSALASWQNGSMTLEKTQYVTDVNSPHHGRISSTSQSILDGNGSIVPNSTVTTALAYSLADGHLTTTSTVTAGNMTTTSSQTTSLTGQLLQTINASGSKKAYEYDVQGRLTRRSDYAPGSTESAVLQYSYTDTERQESTVIRTSSIGEQTKEAFDAVGRPIRTERLHADGYTWLVLNKINYGVLGREDSVTEYDYFPEGSLFLEKSRSLSYNSQGELATIEWSDGLAEGFDHDPVMQQQSHWTCYGNRHSVTTLVIIERPEGGSVHETFNILNGQLISSYTSTYDAVGRLVAESSSTAPRRDYSYDAFGRLIRIATDDEVTTNDYPAHVLTSTATSARLEAQGQSCLLGARTVDSLGRVTETTMGGRTSSISYTGASSWGKTANRSSTAYSYQITLNATYDPYLNLTTETTTGGVARNTHNITSTTQYTRSLRGVLLNEVDGFGNNTVFSYDTHGRLIKTSSATATANFNYDDSGRLVTETITHQATQRAMVTSYTYDAKEREVQRTFASAGFSDLTLAQEYNDASKLVSMALYLDTTLLRKEAFSYDTKSRLATYTCDGHLKPITPEGLILDRQRLSYDVVGNISQIDNTTNGQIFYNTNQYDRTDPTQLVSSTRWKPDGTYSLYTFNYDNNGYLSNNKGATLTYNSLEKLESLNSPKGFHRYLYNNLGQVVGCSGTGYYEQFYYRYNAQYARKGVIIINGQRHNRTSVLLNQSAACVLQQNTKTIENSSSRVDHSFEIKDIKGTVIARYDLSNTTATFFTYTPFGYRPDDGEHSSWIGFNGQPIDRISGGYHLGNGVRVYDPENQNFQIPDSLSPFGEGGANNRSYCHNDPVNYSDPSGHAEIVNQYTVVTHAPAIQDPVVQAVMFGSIGVALAPFTGGASLGWTAAATGLAIASAGFGIAAAALQKSDPTLAQAFGWTSLGTGLLNAGAAVAGAKIAARAALQSSTRLAESRLPMARQITHGTLSRRGNLPAGSSMNGRVNAALTGAPADSTYELYSGGVNSRILYIDAHGTAMSSEHLLAPLPTTEFQFRSGVGVKSADVGTSWQTRVHGTTPYRYAPGATNIPNYILDEFTINELVSIGSLRQTAGYDVTLQALAQQLNADILRPTSTVYLSDLLNDLAAQGFTYDRIIGNFCRGTMAYDTHPLVQSVRRALGFY